MAETSKYPTKEQILNNPPKDIIKDLRILIDWKEQFYKDWKGKSKNQKLAALESLIISLSDNYKKKCKVSCQYDYYFYNPNTKTINIDMNKPSIISTLHEVGHHIYGASELDACVYSVWMFKTVFPAIFRKMKFEGHLLKRHVPKN